MLAAAQGSFAADAPLDCEAAIVLDGALAQKPGGQRYPMTVFATCEAGKWLDAWAECHGYNQAVHDGTILDANTSPARVTLKVALTVHQDAWVGGGAGEFLIEVQRKAAGGPVRSEHPTLRTTRAVETLSGTFKGTFHSPAGRIESSGRAVGILLPPRRCFEGHVPTKTAERPRLLFRAADLPALRKKLTTPLGKALADKLGKSADAVACGLMYRLTGEESFAAKAVGDADRVMALTGGSEIRKCHEWGQRMTHIALAYDLCWDAWTAEYRKKAEDYLDRTAMAAYEDPHGFSSAHSEMMANHGAHHVMGLYSGAGLAGLALWGARGPEPKNPSDPFVEMLMAEGIKKGDKAAMEFLRRKKQYVRDLAIWKANDGADPRYLRLAERGRHSAELNNLYCMGEGGFQGEGEGYTLSWNDVAFDYAAAYRSAFARPVSTRGDITHFLPRYVMTAVWPAGARPVNLTFGVGTGLAGSDYAARAIVLTPPQWRPAVLWYWLKCLGVTAEELRTDAGAAKVAERLANRPLELVYTFLHLSPDDAPAEPGRVMPHVWHAFTRGFTCFRSAWAGADSIVAQIHARQGPGVGFGQPEAGCFQIYGLGGVWAHKTVHGSRAFRYMDNGVLLGAEGLNDGGHGRVGLPLGGELRCCPSAVGREECMMKTWPQCLTPMPLPAVGRASPGWALGPSMSGSGGVGSGVGGSCLGEGQQGAGDGVFGVGVEVGAEHTGGVVGPVDAQEQAGQGERGQSPGGARVAPGLLVEAACLRVIAGVVGQVSGPEEDGWVGLTLVDQGGQCGAGAGGPALAQGAAGRGDPHRGGVLLGRHQGQPPAQRLVALAHVGGANEQVHQIHVGDGGFGQRAGQQVPAMSQGTQRIAGRQKLGQELPLPGEVGRVAQQGRLDRGQAIVVAAGAGGDVGQVLPELPVGGGGGQQQAEGLCGGAIVSAVEAGGEVEPAEACVGGEAADTDAGQHRQQPPVAHPLGDLGVQGEPVGLAVVGIEVPPEQLGGPRPLGVGGVQLGEAQTGLAEGGVHAEGGAILLRGRGAIALAGVGVPQQQSAQGVVLAAVGRQAGQRRGGLVLPQVVLRGVEDFRQLAWDLVCRGVRAGRLGPAWRRQQA